MLELVSIVVVFHWETYRHGVFNLSDTSLLIDYSILCFLQIRLISRVAVMDRACLPIVPVNILKLSVLTFKLRKPGLLQVMLYLLSYIH